MALFSTGLAQEIDIERVAMECSSRPAREVKRNDVPIELFEGVINYLRDNGYDHHLLRLGDPQSVAKLVGGYRESEGKSRGAKLRLKKTFSPWAAGKLGPSLFVDENVNNRFWIDGETADMDLGESHTTAKLIIHILIEAPEIPRNVKRWVKELDGRNPVDLLQGMRLWWKENEARLDLKRWERLEPPEDWSGASTGIPLRIMNTNHKSSSSKPNVSEEPETDTATERYSVALMACLVILFVAFAYILHQRLGNRSTEI